MADVTTQLYQQALGFRENEANRIADSQRSQVQRELEFAEPLLQEQFRRGSRDLDYAQEARGVLRSGETMRKQGELAYDQQAALAELYLGADRQMLGIEEQLSRDLMDITMAGADISAQEAFREAQWNAQQTAQAEALAQQQAYMDYLNQFLDDFYGLGGPTEDEIVAMGQAGPLAGFAGTPEGDELHGMLEQMMQGNPPAQQWEIGDTVTLPPVSQTVIMPQAGG